MKSAYQSKSTRSSQQKEISASLKKSFYCFSYSSCHTATHFFFSLALCVIDHFQATFLHLLSWNPGAVSVQCQHRNTACLSAWPACIFESIHWDLGVVEFSQSIEKPCNPSIELENHKNLSYRVLTWWRWYTLPVRLSFLPPCLITQPVHALLHLPVFMSACMHECMPSWHVWVIWYAHMLLCVPLCVSSPSNLCQSLHTTNPSVILWITSDSQAPPPLPSEH